MSKTEKDKKTINVFISHATADTAYVRKLIDILLHRSNTRVFSPQELSAGEDWSSKLKDEISQSDIFIILVSPNSVRSSWVLQELGAAWSLNKLILPIVTDSQVMQKLPVQLSSPQFLNFSDIEDPKAMNNLLDRYEKKVTASHSSG